MPVTQPEKDAIDIALRSLIDGYTTVENMTRALDITLAQLATVLDPLGRAMEAFNECSLAVADLPVTTSLPMTTADWRGSGQYEAANGFGFTQVAPDRFRCRLHGEPALNPYLLVRQGWTGLFDVEVTRGAASRPLVIEIDHADPAQSPPSFPLWGPGFRWNPVVSDDGGVTWTYILPSLLKWEGPAVAGSSWNATTKRLTLSLPAMPGDRRRIASAIPYTTGQYEADRARWEATGLAWPEDLGESLGGGPIYLMRIGTGPTGICLIEHHVQERLVPFLLRAAVDELVTGATFGSAWAADARAKFTWWVCLRLAPGSYEAGGFRTDLTGHVTNRYGVNPSEAVEGRSQYLFSQWLAARMASTVPLKVLGDIHSAPNSAGTGTGLQMLCAPGSPLLTTPFGAYNPSGLWLAPVAFSAATFAAIGSATGLPYQRPPVPAGEAVGWAVARLKARYPNLHTFMNDSGEIQHANGQIATVATWATGGRALVRALAARAATL